MLPAVGRHKGGQGGGGPLSGDGRTCELLTCWKCGVGRGLGARSPAGLPSPPTRQALRWPRNPAALSESLRGSECQRASESAAPRRAAPRGSRLWV